MLSQKGSSLIYILLVILLIIGGLGYYILNNQSQFYPSLSTDNSQSVVVPKKAPIVSPSPSSSSDMSSWKVYTNTAGHYSVKYSQDYALHVNEVHVSETVADFQPAKDTIELWGVVKKGPPYSIDIQHEAIPSSMTLNSYIDKNSLCAEVSSTSVSGKDVSIDGVGAKVFDTNCGLAGYMYIYAINNNYGYKIGIDPTADSQFLQTFLSGIKFIK